MAVERAVEWVDLCDVGGGQVAGVVGWEKKSKIPGRPEVEDLDKVVEVAYGSILMFCRREGPCDISHLGQDCSGPDDIVGVMDLFKVCVPTQRI